MSSTCTIPIEDILTGFHRTGNRAYTGRHHTKPEPNPEPPTTVHTPARQVAAAARAIHHFYGALETTCYDIIPAPLRRKLEASAQQRLEHAATEQWWAQRSADYPVLIDTMQLPTIGAMK